MFENTTAAAHLFNCEQGKGFFIGARFCPVTQTAPATARGMAYNGIGACIAACIALGVPHVIHQVEVTGIGAGEEDRDTRPL
ncbi:hypothetical protein ASD94_02760 [Acidovorax sp. Root70]|nr:hypothetical protein ASD94_02760 [Acidovorax sp. Root70]